MNTKELANKFDALVSSFAENEEAVMQCTEDLQNAGIDMENPDCSKESLTNMCAIAEKFVPVMA